MIGPVPADFTCECDTPERRSYLVTGSEDPKSPDKQTVCNYCDGCADLAACNWNGVTKSCTRIA